MLSQKVILRERQSLHQLQAADVALLTIEEIAALPLRRVDHRQLAFGFLIDLECARRQGRFENGMRRHDQPVDQASRKAGLGELGCRLRWAKRREGRVRDLPREVDQAAGQRMTRR